MKGSMRAATAVAIGYLLGRKRKFRTAALLTAATAVGSTSVGGLVTKRAMKMIGSTDALGKVAPQVADLVDTVRGDLFSAGKAAVVAAASNRVDALTDSLHERAERVRNPVSDVAEGAGDVARGAGKAASGGGRRAASAAGGAARRVTGRRGRADDEYADEYDDSEPEEPEYDEADEAEDVPDDRDEYPDDADDADDADSEDEQETAGRGRRSGSSGTGRTGTGRKAAATGRPGARRSPVTRTGR
jgi:hypothetical protein